MLHCFSDVGYIDWNAKKDSLHAFAIIYICSKMEIKRNETKTFFPELLLLFYV